MLSTLNDTRLDFIWCNKNNFLSITQNWRKLDKRDKSAVNFCFNCRKRKTWNTTGILSISISAFFVTDFHILEIIASISAKILFFFLYFFHKFSEIGNYYVNFCLDGCKERYQPDEKPQTQHHKDSYFIFVGNYLFSLPCIEKDIANLSQVPIFKLSLPEAKELLVEMQMCPITWIQLGTLLNFWEEGWCLISSYSISIAHKLWQKLAIKPNVYRHSRWKRAFIFVSNFLYPTGMRTLENQLIKVKEDSV